MNGMWFLNYGSVCFFLTDIDSMSKVTDMDNDLDSLIGDALKPAPQIIQAGYKPTPLQRPFQSSSTPVHLSQRFMVRNCHQSSTGRQK
jgi:hypothetical protein